NTSQNKREWIHVYDHVREIYKILMHGKTGETYNVGTGVEKSIEEISAIILKYLHAPETMKEYVNDRPAHDRRYLLNSTKIKRELDWKPLIDFEQGMQETIAWYKQNPKWWKPLTKNLVKETNWKIK
ncbi:MAG: GDP-mannose 4,6-dehydratase, partial [Nanoarchaeota archaeon]